MLIHEQEQLLVIYTPKPLDSNEWKLQNSLDRITQY